MPEKRIEELPPGGTQRSFQVLAEWLRDNRRALQDQMAGLAVRFEEIDRENKRRLDEIHEETRKTNGRVTDGAERTRELEKRIELDTVLKTGHTKWERDRLDAESAQKVRREKRFDRLANFGYVALGLLGGGLGHWVGIY